MLILQICIYVTDFKGEINISEKGVLFTEEGIFYTNSLYHFENKCVYYALIRQKYLTYIQDKTVS